MKIVAGEGKKSEILGGLAEGGPVKGGPGEGVWGGGGPGEGRGCGGKEGSGQSRHWPNTEIGPKHIVNLAKNVSLGQSSFGQTWFGPNLAVAGTHRLPLSFFLFFFFSPTCLERPLGVPEVVLPD